MDPLTVASFGQRHLAKAQDINVLRKQMKNCNLSYIKTTRILKFLYWGYILMDTSPFCLD